MKLIILPNLMDRKGRIYSAKEINDTLVHTKEFLGTLSGQDSKLTNVSHRVYDLHMDNGSLYGSFKFVSTPMGYITEALAKHTLMVPSVRGIGTLVGSTVTNFILQSVDLAPVEDNYFMDRHEFITHTGVINPIPMQLQLTDNLIEMNHIMVAMQRIGVPVGFEFTETQVDLFFRNTNELIRFSVMLDPSVRQLV